MDPMAVTLFILLVAVILYLTELIPLSATAIGVPTALYLSGVLDVKETFAGLTDGNVILFTAMFVIGGSFLYTGIAGNVGEWVGKRVRGEKRVMVALMVLAMVLSSFLSNTGTAAVLLPVALGICAAEGYSPSKLLMPMAVGCAMGGINTLIGSPPNLIAKSALELSHTTESFGFFEFARAGVPLCVIALLYFIFWGYKHLPSIPLEEDYRRQILQSETDCSPAKRRICAGVFLLVVLLIMLEKVTGVPIEIVAVAGAVILLALRVIPEKVAFASIDWTTICLLAGMIPMANALSKTGAADMISDQIISLVGKDTSGVVFTALLFFIVCLITQFMSNTASASLVAPIAVTIAEGLGYSPKSVLIAVTIAASCALATPVGTPPNTLVMGHGRYQFKDYVKLGLPLIVLCFLATILLIPFLWPYL